MSDDRRLAELFGTALEPKPMDARARAAFRRAVERRLEARDESRLPWRSALVFATSAAVAAALWLSLRSSAPSEPVEIARETAPVSAPVREEPVTETLEDRSETPVLAAFADPDELLDEADGSEQYLPDDYFVLANLVDELEG